MSENTQEILLIEPQKNQGKLYQKTLHQAGYHCQWFSSYSQAIASEGTWPSLLLCAITDWNESLVEHFAQLRVQYPDARLVILIHFSNSELAAKAMCLGAEDFFLSPMDPELLLQHVHGLTGLSVLNDVIAEDWQSRRTLQLAKRVARTQATVLISGESGTGKEVLAQFIHRHSPRREAPFVAVNCAAIPTSMLESILFGHEKGAYTGAVNSRVGKFEQADGGTLFLDEIGELPVELQAKLLRVLQEREVERLGSRHVKSLDLRVIAATNQNLKQKVSLGEFREDLFYRLDVFPLSWVPLRVRRDDILPLAKFFIDRYREELGFQCKVQITEQARSRLKNYSWPGNVRELENVIHRTLILCNGEVINAKDLLLADEDCYEPMIGTTDPFNPDIPTKECEETPPTAVISNEFQRVIDALQRFNGHRTKAAADLGVTTRALRYRLAKMKEQGIDINSVLSASIVS